MHVVHHTIASAVISGILAFFTRSSVAFFSCFLSGIFIDLDHALDFCIAKKKFFVLYDELERFCAIEKEGKLFLVLHSFEGNILLWILVLSMPMHVFWLGLAVGLSTHLVLDIFVNPFKLISYSFTYRWIKNFTKEKLFIKDYYKNIQ